MNGVGCGDNPGYALVRSRVGSNNARANVIEHNTVGEPSSYVVAAACTPGDRVLLERNVFTQSGARHSIHDGHARYAAGSTSSATLRRRSNVNVGNQATCSGSGASTSTAQRRSVPHHAGGKSGRNRTRRNLSGDNFHGQPAQRALCNTIIVARQWVLCQRLGRAK